MLCDSALRRVVLIACLGTLAPREAACAAEAASDAAPAVPANPTVKFELDVMPILTKAACNSGPCHGKARGQNGFQLSLLGFDPEFDYASLVKDARGRRLFPAAPDNSLLLRKAAARLPHGGGERLKFGSAEYQTIRRWIEQGMPRTTRDDPTLVGISLSPEEHVLAGGSQEQLLVTARYSDGSTRDVTAMTDFESSESAIVAVDGKGLVKAGMLAGDAAIMARYMGLIATWNTVIPLPEKPDPAVYASLPRKNFIDGLVWEKLEKLGMTPSETAPDSTFLRRAFLDVIGRLPTPEETLRFPGRRFAQQARNAGRPPVGAAGIRRLLGQQVGRSAASERLPRRNQGHAQSRRLASRRLPPQPALQSIRPRAGDGQRQHLA